MYGWEFEALVKGSYLRTIDELERDASQLFNQRYVENAKRPKINKIFDRKKLEKQLENSGTVAPQEARLERTRLLKRMQKAFS